MAVSGQVVMATTVLLKVRGQRSACTGLRSAMDVVSR
jgi:hypothetical protein